MSMEQQQVEPKLSRQTKRSSCIPVEKHQVESAEKLAARKEEEENISCRQKEELQQQTNNSEFNLLLNDSNNSNNNDNTNSNQNKIVLARDSEQSQNMLLDCRGQNLHRNRNRNQTNNNSNNKYQYEEITLKALVRKIFEKPKQYWFVIGTILLFATFLTTTTLLVEAKIHHSKRQAPDQSSSSPSSSQAVTSLTGRENTNWWNLWWQQYISDAIQPTVRPIISVSFNGKTINLADQQPESADSNNIAQIRPETRDVDTNFVLNNLNSPEMNPIDLERNEKLRLISSNLPDNMHPFAAKQMMLAQRKSIQQQANWQSVKPTMIQMAQHESRPNRQADLNQDEDTSGGQSSADLGIQMRAKISQRQKDQLQPQQQHQLIPKPSSGQVIKQTTNSLPNFNNQQQQQQLMEDDNVRFEQQQQNQMVDYSEETEPELENNISNNATGLITEGDDQGRGGQEPSTGGRMSGDGQAVNSVDSSSSSMMQVEPQRQRELAQPMAVNESSAAMNERARQQQQQQQQQGNVTQVDSIRTKTQGDDNKPTNGSIESQRGNEVGQSRVESSTMFPSTTSRASFMGTSVTQPQSGIANDAAVVTTTTRRQPQTTSTTQRQAGSKVQQSGTMATTTPSMQRPSSTTRMNDNTRDGSTPPGGKSMTTPLTSTVAPLTSTSTSPRLIMSTSTDNVDLNETPISIMTETEAEQANRAQTREQQPTSKATTPTGRVELQNGRPATGNRQMATTTSARLPTKPTTSGSSSTTPQNGFQTTRTQTTNSTPNPASNALDTRQSDASTNAQPGMRIVTTLPTLKPRDGVVDSIATTMRVNNASISNVPTQSSNLRPETTTSAPEASSSSGTTDSPNTDSGDDSDDEDEESSTNSSGNDIKQSSGNNTTSSDSTSDESSDSNDDSGSTTDDSDNEQEQTTTVSTPTTTKTTLSTSVTQSTSFQTTAGSKQTSGSARTSQSQAEPKVTTTTQPPALTTIDIERLPAKGSSSGLKSPMSSMMMRMLPTTSSSTPADISRITRPSPTTSSSSTTSSAQTNQSQQRQQQQQIQMPNANLIMMNLDQTKPGTIDGETAITMPIDTLMKMMMMNQIMRENNELRGSTMPIISSDQTTQTPMMTTSSSANSETGTTGNSNVEFSSQATPTQSTTLSTGERLEIASTAIPKKIDDETDKNNVSQADDIRNTTMFKKKLQPPPTTRQPIPSKIQTGGQSPSETRQTIAMQTTTTSPFTTSAPATTTTTTVATTATSTSPTTIEADGPTQKTMFVNFETSDDSMMDVSGASRAEPKIDLINLDLLPIQRIMNSQSNKMNDKLRANNGTTPKSSAQPSMEQQKLSGNEIMRGTQKPMQQMDQLIQLEVEPGMRLRPPIGMAGVMMRTSKTDNGQMIGSTKTAVNSPANPIYTIMASNSAAPTQQQEQQTKAHSKKPALLTTNDQLASTQKAPVKSTPPPPGMSGSSRTTSQTQREIADMMMIMMMRQSEQSDRQSTSTRPADSGDFGSVTTITTTTTTTTKPPASLEIEQQTRFNTTTTSATSQSPSTSSRGFTTMRPSSISNTTSPSRSTPRLQEEANSSTVPNLTSAMVASTSSPTITMTTATPIPRGTEGEPQQKSTKETPGAPSSPQPIGNNQQQQQQQVDSQRMNNNRFDRIQQQPSSEPRRPQQVGTKTGKVNQQALNKASNLTSSLISPKLRSDLNKFSSSRVHAQQPVRMNEKLVAPQKDAAAESIRQSSMASAQPTTTQSPAFANSMMQNMAIRQFGGANRMSALANQPVPFGRPSAMTVQQQQPQNKQQRFELPSFEYGPSIAVRRPDEPLANGQIPNCTLTGKNFCVLTKDYPMNEVRQAVERSFRSVRIMYEELQTVSDQELHKDDFNATNNQAASGKFACQTQVEMMRPGWAKDEITKEWMLVVNTDVFPQKVRTESCAQPNTPCEFIAPFYDSTCQQRYSLHRMIAIDPHDPTRSPQVAVFKFPAGCVCRVHPIRKTTTATMLAQTTTSTLSTTASPVTMISSSTSRSIRKRR